MKTLDMLMAGRSMLLITYRPEGLKDMDKILVLDRGRIVVRGDHGHLLNIEAPIDI